MPSSNQPDAIGGQSATTPSTSHTATRDIATCALCIALLIASCLFTIPLGPVPFTLQTLVVVLIALLFSPKLAVATTGIYLLMGAIGLPVFSSMTGGLGKLLGPTGGFLFSYLVGTFLATILRQLLERHGLLQLACDICAALVVLIVSYLMGWAWIMVVMQLTPLEAFLSAVAPFVIVDCLKAVVAVTIATGVRQATGR